MKGGQSEGFMSTHAVTAPRQGSAGGNAEDRVNVWTKIPIALTYTFILCIPTEGPRTFVC